MVLLQWQWVFPDLNVQTWDLNNSRSKTHSRKKENMRRNAWRSKILLSSGFRNYNLESLGKIFDHLKFLYLFFFCPSCGINCVKSFKTPSFNSLLKLTLADSCVFFKITMKVFLLKLNLVKKFDVECFRRILDEFGPENTYFTRFDPVSFLKQK